MTSSIYGITVTVLVMYIFLGTNVTFGKLRKNFAHVFGKRNEGLITDNSDNMFDRQTSDPVLDKLRLYRQLAARGQVDDLTKSSFYNEIDDVRPTNPAPFLEPYGNERKDSLTLLDIISPVEKEFLSYLYDMDAEDGRASRFPKYV